MWEADLYVWGLSTDFAESTPQVPCKSEHAGPGGLARLLAILAHQVADAFRVSFVVRIGGEVWIMSDWWLTLRWWPGVGGREKPHWSVRGKNIMWVEPWKHSGPAYLASPVPSTLPTTCSLSGAGLDIFFAYPPAALRLLHIPPHRSSTFHV